MMILEAAAFILSSVYWLALLGFLLYTRPARRSQGPDGRSLGYVGTTIMMVLGYAVSVVICFLILDPIQIVGVILFPLLGAALTARISPLTPSILYAPFTPVTFVRAWRYVTHSSTDARAGRDFAFRALDFAGERGTTFTDEEMGELRLVLADDILIPDEDLNDLERVVRKAAQGKRIGAREYLELIKAEQSIREGRQLAG